jgi:hypothetical protein
VKYVIQIGQSTQENLLATKGGKGEGYNLSSDVIIICLGGEWRGGGNIKM